MLLKGRFQIIKGYQNNHMTIGFGSYGQVKLARDLANGNVVAVKMIKKIAKNEVAMHNRLIHPNIIKLIDVYIDNDRQITYMILEYADSGTLFEKIKTQSISKRQIRRYFRDICQAVAYLHKQNIMHRDIKPENVLLTKVGQAKLCDFGFATILGERKTLCGTYEYMSPQMIQNRNYDNKIDIWALGILLFEMIAGHAPFRGDRPEDVLQKMKTTIYFSQKFESQEINLIKMILRVTPHKRPTIQQILQQPFFSKQDKHDEKYLEVQSTINTQDYFIKISSMPHLREESTHNNKMIDGNKPVNKDYQKQTYPPFYYVPKAQYKMGTKIAMNYQRMQLNGSLSVQELKNRNIIEPIYTSIPMNTVGQINVNDKCFSSLFIANKTMTSQKFSSNQQSQIHTRSYPLTHLFFNKSNAGFGRYS